MQNRILWDLIVRYMMFPVRILQSVLVWVKTKQKNVKTWSFTILHRVQTNIFLSHYNAIFEFFFQMKFWALCTLTLRFRLATLTVWEICQGKCISCRLDRTTLCTDTQVHVSCVHFCTPLGVNGWTGNCCPGLIATWLECSVGQCQRCVQQTKHWPVLFHWFFSDAAFEKTGVFTASPYHAASEWLNEMPNMV